MPDNLTVTIGIDTAKLRADAAIVKEELRKVNAEVTAAAKAGDVGAVQAGAAEQDRLARQLLETNQQIRTNTALKQENTVVTARNTETNAEATLTAQKFGVELGHVAHAAGLPIEGIRALRVGFLALAGVEIVRGLTEITSKITDLTRLSKETGFDPKTIQQWTLAVEQAGGTAAEATTAISKLGAAFTEARAKASYTQFGAKFEDDALKRLNIDVTQFKAGSAGLDQFLQKVAQALVALNRAGKVDEANLASVQLLGKSYESLAKALEQAASGDLSKLKAEITPEDAAAVERYNQAVLDLIKAWEGLKTSLVDTGAFTDVINFVNDLTKGIQDSIDQVKTLVWWVKALASFYGLADAPTSGPPAFNFGGPGSRDYGGGGDPVTGATGGYVRGPGSGTSDSIAARLSNGEFVLNAGSVRRLGVGFLHGLNSFAAGGLVGAMPSFATGGLVATAGGATVNLHFPGGSFQLRADNEIVAGLVREGRRAGMLSAGRMPGALA